jgi:hypothetical protein
MTLNNIVNNIKIIYNIVIMQSNERSKSNLSNESNGTVDFFIYEESIGSSYSVSSSKKLPNYTNHEINEKLLSEYENEYENKLSKKINNYIFYLICLIILAIISCVILFIIYQFTNNHKLLYKYAFGCFIFALLLSLFLCSCMLYRCELEKKDVKTNMASV